MSDPKSFALYHYQSCPFCVFTIRAIEGLNLHVELRDILKDPAHRSTLITEGGKQQVPCLRIESPEGQVQWLYESRDIVDYLRSYVESV